MGRTDSERAAGVNARVITFSSPCAYRPSTWSVNRRRYHGFATALLAVVIDNEVVGALVRGPIELRPLDLRSVFGQFDFSHGLLGPSGFRFNGHKVPQVK